MMAGQIAILDDDASLRRALARLLEACSHRVKTYGTAAEFIDSLRLETPACLITDLQMPGMTGSELQHHLAGTGKKIPIIILTGHDEPGAREKCLEAGAVAFLIKPVMPAPLLKAIAAALERYESLLAS